MTKRTETKTGALIYVMDEPSFDREIIAKNPNVPQCGVSDIANGNGYLRLQQQALGLPSVLWTCST